MLRHNISPSAGRMRPNTSASGIFSTKRKSPVSTSTLTRMLVPKPNNAFQSPGTQNLGLLSMVALIPMFLVPMRYCFSAAITSSLFPTQPKIPPWALIIFSPISWNSGK